ncbi:hypothetical protein AX15_006322 [Amanita polypyramis BW_CC]|nr:hypothetical protein AX15_006322 [Amanita polypyramis BW_CC]
MSSQEPVIDQVSRSLRPGIYVPVPTFFLPDSEDLDIPTFERHVTRVALAGANPVIAGTQGEAIHLSQTERVDIIRAARRALDIAGLKTVPIISGTGGGSTRETLLLTKQAAAAGADYALVIASGYFSSVLATNKSALKAYWKEISEKSSIPVMIYNFPGASGGIDLDSDLITELASECPNICGVKLTCGNVGKLTRIAAVVSGKEFDSLHPRKDPLAPFLVLGGYSDFILPSAFSNAHGAITGLANIAPRSIYLLYKLSVQGSRDPSVLAEARRLQGIIAQADYTIAQASVAGTKALLDKLHGYGGVPRKPLPALSPGEVQALWDHSHTQALVKLERELSSHE